MGLGLVATGQYLSELGTPESPLLSEVGLARASQPQPAQGSPRDVRAVSFVPSASTPPTGSTATAALPQAPPPLIEPSALGSASQLRRARDELAALETSDEAVAHARSRRVAALDQQLAEADLRNGPRVNNPQAGGAPNLEPRH